MITGRKSTSARSVRARCYPPLPFARLPAFVNRYYRKPQPGTYRPHLPKPARNSRVRVAHYVFIRLKAKPTLTCNVTMVVRRLCMQLTSTGSTAFSTQRTRRQHRTCRTLAPLCLIRDNYEYYQTPRSEVMVAAILQRRADPNAQTNLVWHAHLLPAMDLCTSTGLPPPHPILAIPYTVGLCRAALRGPVWQQTDREAGASMRRQLGFQAVYVHTDHANANDLAVACSCSMRMLL